eukprot:COSAG06_NODE_66119_length_255_cov_0.660256_1_plen_71_part_01
MNRLKQQPERYKQGDISLELLLVVSFPFLFLVMRVRLPTASEKQTARPLTDGGLCLVVACAAGAASRRTTS